jgi:hypothetical protein
MHSRIKCLRARSFQIFDVVFLEVLIFAFDRPKSLLFAPKFQKLLSKLHQWVVVSVTKVPQIRNYAGAEVTDTTTYWENVDNNFWKFCRRHRKLPNESKDYSFQKYKIEIGKYDALSQTILEGSIFSDFSILTSAGHNLCFQILNENQ